MMQIAILGATSQIAKDLLLSFSRQGREGFTLFARRPNAVSQWLCEVGLDGCYSCVDFVEFSEDQQFDAIINFVGVGDPALAANMGASIFDVTLKYDEIALNYVRSNPGCRYLFLSSGAVYGENFGQPVNADSRSHLAINNFQPQDWYAVAKLHAECRHRSMPELPIIDIRVFNYFSHTMDMNSKFLIADVFRAIRDNSLLRTAPQDIVRDYVHPSDFFDLVNNILLSPPANMAIDVYSKKPIGKFEMLECFRREFGLSYEVDACYKVMNATGVKPNYYSLNRKAEVFSYSPKFTSAICLGSEIRTALNQCKKMIASGKACE